MGILARQSWARPVTSARATKRTFCDVYDAQIIVPFIPLPTDRNVHPALPVCNAAVHCPDASARKQWQPGGSGLGPGRTFSALHGRPDRVTMATAAGVGCLRG